jgi:neutral ceramidase
VVAFIVQRIVESIRKASDTLIAANLYNRNVHVPSAVANRLIKGGFEDDLLRTIEIRRKDGVKILLMSFTAHATCLFSRDLMLSRDYPGALVDTMENRGYDFAMFLAGAVGSQRCSAPDAGESCIPWMAQELADAYSAAVDSAESNTDNTLAMLRVPFPLPDPQVKVLPEWKVRSWFFRAAFGEYPASLTGLRVGNTILLGTPCDFSAEFNPAIDSLAARLDKHVMVTSFNGGYIGYITPQERYHINHYETQLMNWYAPGTGEYMQKSLIDIMDILSNN